MYYHEFYNIICIIPVDVWCRLLTYLGSEWFLSLHYRKVFPKLHAKIKKNNRGLPRKKRYTLISSQGAATPKTRLKHDFSRRLRLFIRKTKQPVTRLGVLKLSVASKILFPVILGQSLVAITSTKCALPAAFAHGVVLQGLLVCETELTSRK